MNTLLPHFAAAVIERVVGPIQYNVVRPVHALKRPRMFAPKAKNGRIESGQVIVASELVKVEGDASDGVRVYVKVNLRDLRLDGSGGNVVVDEPTGKLAETLSLGNSSITTSFTPPSWQRAGGSLPIESTTAVSPGVAVWVTTRSRVSSL